MKKVLSMLILIVTLTGIFCLTAFAATTRISGSWQYNNVGYLGNAKIGSNKVITVKPTDRDGNYGAFQVNLPANTAYENKKITLYAYTSGFLGITTNRGEAVLYNNRMGWPGAAESGIFNMPIKQSTGATYNASPSFSMPLSVTNTDVSFKTVSSGLNKGWYKFTADIIAS